MKLENNLECFELVAIEAERIDKYIAIHSSLSRSQIQKLIKNNNIKVNNKVISNANSKVSKEDIITICYLKEEDYSHIKPTEINFEIVFEDQYFLIINKPSGLVTHPAPGHYNDTLVNGLLYLKKQLADQNDLARPGIVHRIDKDTSGLLIVAKTLEVLNTISKMIKNKEIKRYYLALVENPLTEKRGDINLPIGRCQDNRQKYCVNAENGKNAITKFKLIEQFKNCALVECELETGRTHQIRVHFEYIKHSIINDPLYSKKHYKQFENYGQFLHSYKLVFNHPFTNMEIKIELPIPIEFKQFIEQNTI